MGLIARVKDELLDSNKILYWFGLSICQFLVCPLCIYDQNPTHFIKKALLLYCWLILHWGLQHHASQGCKFFWFCCDFVLQIFFGERLAFLPLLSISVYNSFGIFYAYLLILWTELADTYGLGLSRRSLKRQEVGVILLKWSVIS